MRQPSASPRRRAVALALLLGWLVAIFGGSSSTVPEPVSGLALPDWLLHGAEYAVLGLLAARYLHLRTLRTGAVVLVLVPAAFALLYGASDEWHQSFVPGRDPDSSDALADLLGGLVGAAAYRFALLAHLRRGLAVAAAALVLLASAARGMAGPDADPSARGAEAIRPADLAATAGFLASEALRGRESPSPDADRAARYLAERFRAAGLEPGGKDGSWFQPFPMAFRVDDGRSLLRLVGTGAPREFPREDLALVRDSGEGTGAGPVVFAGYGLSAPDAGRDDYAGLDVGGKVVLVFDGLPGRKDPEARERYRRDGRIAGQAGIGAKAALAAGRGAVALIVARGPLDGTVDRLRLADGRAVEGKLTKVSGGYRLAMAGARRLPVPPADVERVVLADGSVVRLRGGGREDLELPAATVERFFPFEAVAAVEEGVVPLPEGDYRDGRLPGRAPEGRIPILRISAGAAAEILGRPDLAALEEAVDAAPGSFEAEGRVAVVRVETGAEAATTRNVVALVPGREGGGQAVVVSAHYDHVGVDREGEVFRGADDNASGTAVLVAVAEAFAAAGERPRRPVLLVALSGEEKGMLGSAAFVADPPLPLDSLLAALNADMVGRGPGDELEGFVGPLGTDLAEVLEAAAKRAGVRLVLEVVGPPDGAIPPPGGRAKLSLPVPRTRDNLFGRSDHTTFYRKGVPAAFLFGGIHDDYHRPTDVPEKLNPDRMASAARILFFAAFRLAEGGGRDP